MPKITKSIFSGRMLCVFLYGISSGLPLLLIGPTLKYWMRAEKVDLTVIGIYTLVSLPYSFKFLWAPFMDRYIPSFLGRRRGWILIFQACLALGLAAMAVLHPAQSLKLMAVVAFFVAFFSASQDIAIDAYRREILTDDELGLGSSMGVNGYYVGILLAGGFAIFLSAYTPWRVVYLVMAGIIALSAVTTLLSPEPKGTSAPRNLRDAFVLPFREYFTRTHAIEVLVFLLLFKVGDSMASSLFNPFYYDKGYSPQEIGAVIKTFGFWATIIGGTAGGVAMLKIGTCRSLWSFGILQTISTFAFSILAKMGHSLPLLTGVVVFENFCTGMATTAYVGFMMSLCSKRFTGTQYALLSSLIGVPRTFFGAAAGYLAKSMGWASFFVLCTILHIPGLLMLVRFHLWPKPKETT